MANANHHHRKPSKTVNCIKSQISRDRYVRSGKRATLAKPSSRHVRLSILSRCTPGMAACACGIVKGESREKDSEKSGCRLG